MDHNQAYPDGYTSQILNSVKTIAVIGAVPDENKASNRVIKFLDNKGFNVIPVFPRKSVTHIQGLKTVPSLQDIDQPVDMVDIFRRPDRILPIVHEAIDLRIKVIWMQLNIQNFEAAQIAENAGLKVVMNRCPIIELQNSE